MLSGPVIKRLTLARYLFEVALQNARSEQETAAAACVHLLQDAVEVFFLASFDHFDIPIAVRTDFPQYFDKLSEKLGFDLPYRRRLLEINRVRVHSKHEGIPPNPKEVSGYVTDARKFFEEVCQKVFGSDFWTISLVELLDEGEQKKLLTEADKLFRKGDHLECLIECRKAFYVAFENDYNIKRDLSGGWGLLFGSSAPYFARNKEYADKNVKTPFDYIVLDHASIDAQLMKEGVDNTAFWNVRRLTPEVYRHEEKDPWLVKHDLEKREKEGIADRAAYVLSAVTSMLLARQENKRMMRSHLYVRYDVRLKKKSVVVYEKADKTGPVAGTIPDDIESVVIDYATDGLNDNEVYWSVSCFRPKSEETTFFMLHGFALQEDLDLDG